LCGWGGFAPGRGAKNSEEEGIAMIFLQFGSLELPSGKQKAKKKT
jgi:hypothetical protein